MATDREFSVILKATDLSTQPINQIVEALRKLTEAQKANNEAAAKGVITAKDFKDNLETAKSAAGGLAGAITVLQRVQDQMARTAKQGEALADMRAKLNAKQAETPPDAEPPPPRGSRPRSKPLRSSVWKRQWPRCKSDTGRATPPWKPTSPPSRKW